MGRPFPIVSELCLSIQHYRVELCPASAACFNQKCVICGRLYIYWNGQWSHGITWYETAVTHITWYLYDVNTGFSIKV